MCATRDNDVALDLLWERRGVLEADEIKTGRPAAAGLKPSRLGLEDLAELLKDIGIHDGTCCRGTSDAVLNANPRFGSLSRQRFNSVSQRFIALSSHTQRDRRESAPAA